MSEPFIAEIRMWPGNFAPRGFAFCNGQLLPISQNTALFSLIGTFYGGNGQTNFALPNLQGQTPLMAGQGPGLSSYSLGESGGSTSVTLTTGQMPAHAHLPGCDNGSGSVNGPGGQVWGVIGRGKDPAYAAAGSAMMNAQALGFAGGGQGHNNQSPFLTVNFLIALNGIYPARN